jgi:hypothetical protein
MWPVTSKAFRSNVVALAPGSCPLWLFLLHFSFPSILVLNNGLPLKAQTFCDF